MAHDEKSVNCLKLIKNGYYMISGGSDRTIGLYKIIYQYDSWLKKTVFENCEFEKKFVENGFVYSLNHSSIDPNIIFSSSSDCTVKVWNIVD